MGVAYDTFWHLNPTRMKPIEKAYEMQIEAKQAKANLDAWLTGLYNSHAIASVLNSKNKYPKKPFDIFGKEKPKTPEQEAEEFKEYVRLKALKRKQLEAMG